MALTTAPKASRRRLPSTRLSTSRLAIATAVSITRGAIGAPFSAWELIVRPSRLSSRLTATERFYLLKCPIPTGRK